MGTGFNADERAKAREEGPITIGGQTYHARRLTNQRLRQIRRLSRDATRDARAAAKESEEYKQELEDALRDGETREEAEKRALDAGMASEAVDQINTNSLVAQLPMLVVDDNMQPPSEETIRHHLEEDLDTRDVGDLMAHLLGPDKDDADRPPGS